MMKASWSNALLTTEALLLTYVQLELAVLALSLCLNSDAVIFSSLPAVFGLLFVVHTLKLHLILTARLNSYCEAMDESLVLKPLQSSLLRVNDLAFTRCSSMGSKQSSDSGINLGLKLGGHGAQGRRRREGRLHNELLSWIDMIANNIYIQNSIQDSDVDVDVDAGIAESMRSGVERLHV
jgi:hypothetical protein